MAWNGTRDKVCKKQIGNVQKIISAIIVPSPIDLMAFNYSVLKFFNATWISKSTVSKSAG